MTSPDGSRGSSPLRVGGLALLGVGRRRRRSSGVVALNSGGGTPPPVAAPSLSTAAARRRVGGAAAPTAAPAAAAARASAPAAAAGSRPPAAPQRRPAPARGARTAPPPPAPARPGAGRRCRRGRRLRLRGRRAGRPRAGAGLQQQHDQRPGRARRRRLPRRRLDGRRRWPTTLVRGSSRPARSTSGPAPAEQSLRASASARVRPAGRAALRRADRRQPRPDRHRHQRLPEQR